ncbi:MAG: tRNA 4-thiouridine(8) synthase ThiI, partial [Lachnospiraceae bacterium]|nr:tRNA 4-thiouridine(8) synthase ThiI [Lachnospiraceae bacterium]
MKYTAFLIKYAEIAIKGKNRGLFEEALVKQIKYALKKSVPAESLEQEGLAGFFEVTKASGRIYIECLREFDLDEVVGNLRCVFGITGICPVRHVADEGFDRLSEEVIRFVDEVYPDKHKTFKVNARRARKDYPLNSQEINMELGGRILDRFPELKVDVHTPEIWLNIEIRERIY